MTPLPNTAVKQTPLYDMHRQLGARMIPFGGWAMPVSYRGIIEEHVCVRNQAGLFDVSHMGEIEISGPQAETAVQYLTLNDIRTLEPYQLQYSAMCNDDGGLLDDLTVCRLASDRFVLIVNAANIDKDFNWIAQHLPEGAKATNLSDAKALLALQGPESQFILQHLTEADLPGLAYYHALPARVANLDLLITRTGYTGEDGFELLVDAADAVALWQALMDAGRDSGLLPIGLGARDTLRLEARYLLYGVDMDETCNPFEVGLSWMTRLSKGSFIGREALLNLKEAGLRRRLVGFVMQERGVPRTHYAVKTDGAVIGSVTSGTMSPTLGQAVGTAMVDIAYAKKDTEFAIDVRGKAIQARVVPPPFVPHRVKR